MGRGHTFRRVLMSFGQGAGSWVFGVGMQGCAGLGVRVLYAELRKGLMTVWWRLVGSHVFMGGCQNYGFFLGP